MLKDVDMNGTYGTDIEPAYFNKWNKNINIGFSNPDIESNTISNSNNSSIGFSETEIGSRDTASISLVSKQMLSQGTSTLISLPKIEFIPHLKSSCFYVAQDSRFEHSLYHSSLQFIYIYI